MTFFNNHTVYAEEGQKRVISMRECSAKPVSVTPEKGPTASQDSALKNGLDIDNSSDEDTSGIPELVSDSDSDSDDDDDTSDEWLSAVKSRKIFKEHDSSRQRDVHMHEQDSSHQQEEQDSSDQEEQDSSETEKPADVISAEEMKRHLKSLRKDFLAFNVQ